MAAAWEVNGSVGWRADGRRVNGCGQTGRMTHGNEEGRSLGRLPSPWLTLLDCCYLLLNFASILHDNRD